MKSMVADMEKIKERSAAGVIFWCSSSQKILLVLRSPNCDSPNTWCIPGGKVEKNESLAEAAKREISEEIGITVKSELLEPLFSKKNKTFIDNETGLETRFVFYSFLYTVDDEFACRLSSEHTDSGWFSMDNLPSPLHPEMDIKKIKELLNETI